MNHRPLRAIAMALIALAGAACGAGTSSATPTPTPTPAAATFEESSAAFCSAFGSLIRGVGNPDAGTPSVLSKALDDAVAAGDVAAADRAAASITTELEAGRQQAAAAARWQPAAPTMVAMDRVLVAFEAGVAAKRAAAAHTPGAIDPQKAFEGAGGVQAWSALLQAAGSMPVPSGASPKPCPAFSGQP
jgi:hypothetical protein